MTLSERLRSHADVDFDGLFREAADELDSLYKLREQYDNDQVVYEEKITRLTARVAELERDAERYRWLRQWPTHFATEVWGRYGAGLPLDKIFVNQPEKLDAAIDAAMENKDGR